MSRTFDVVDRRDGSVLHTTDTWREADRFCAAANAGHPDTPYWVAPEDAPAKPKRTREQKAALAAYEFALRQEDRYMGSVFVTAEGQRQQEAKTAAAYAACKALGLDNI